MSGFLTAPAPNTSYFTPAQVPPAGTPAPTARDGTPVPSLFQPIKIRGLEFHNRLFDSSVTPFHTAMLGAVLARGPGLTFIEATAVSPEGRCTPHDNGLWSDEQVAPLRALVSEFAHSQGQKIGLQLAHAGRKGSTMPLWIAPFAVIPDEFDFSGPPKRAMLVPEALQAKNSSTVDLNYVSKELSKEGIKRIVAQWAAAAKRAVDAGIDVIEIHAAHGFLLHEFLSLVSNKRTDELSATDWLEKVLPNEPSWQLEDTIRLSTLVAAHGVDLIDVSSGGLDSRQKIEFAAPAYQAHLAEAVKRAVGDRVLVGAIGGIKTGKLAQEVLDKGQADIVLAGTQFLKDPAAVATFLEDLGVEIKTPNQVERVLTGRGSVWRWRK